MTSRSTIDFAQLFDAAAYMKSGHCPWTFFAYPTSLAVEHGLPPDESACQLLGEVQSRGIAVAIWVNGIAPDTTYFACRGEDRERLHAILDELTSTGQFAPDFLRTSSEGLFALAQSAASDQVARVSKQSP
ncbi:MAG: hypothetical protein KDA58_02445 [Planctomycetaceae bacterium]|nr:hypothetical protein [Planctomycetaceae bacterium]